MALNGIDSNSLWVAEEARVFPQRFSLLGIWAPSPGAMQVQVSADGPVEVRTHGGPLPLRSLSAAAALLCLPTRGSLGSERVLESLALPGRSVRDRRKARSHATRELREVLDWPGQ